MSSCEDIEKTLATVPPINQDMSYIEALEAVLSAPNIKDILQITMKDFSTHHEPWMDQVMAQDILPKLMSRNMILAVKDFHKKNGELPTEENLGKILHRMASGTVYDLLTACLMVLDSISNKHMPEQLRTTLHVSAIAEILQQFAIVHTVQSTGDGTYDPGSDEVH